MNYRRAVKEFQQQNIGLYLREVDYWRAQEAWSIYTDMLCKEGKITPKQYNTWRTPFEFGKRLSLTEWRTA